MSDDALPRRRPPLGLIGGLAIAAAAVLVVLVALPRHTTRVDGGAEATTACRAFDDVYAATKPGTPMNGPALASQLDRAIDHMHRAAAADHRWRALAASLDDVGTAVNAGDAPGSFSAMQDVHARCGPVLHPGTRNA